MEALLLATRATHLHLHPMPTERSLLYRFRPRRGGPVLSRQGCSSGKGDTRKGDTRPYHPVRTYLTQDVHGQVHQPKNVPLVPWVQHADVVGDVVGAALHPSQGGLLKPDTAGSPCAPHAPLPSLGAGGGAPSAPPAWPAGGMSRVLVAPQAQRWAGHLLPVPKPGAAGPLGMGEDVSAGPLEPGSSSSRGCRRIAA